jgi:hypothetical protein
MAKAVGFELIGSYRTEELRRGLLANSLTFKVGDVIKPLSSTANVYTNASCNGDVYVLGVVVGFSKANGEVIGTGQNPANTPAQLITASDNTTVDKYYAVFLPIKENMTWRALLSAVAGTTAASNDEYAWMNLSDARTLDESSALVPADASAPLQFLSYGVDSAGDSTSFSVIGKFAKALLTRP